MAKFVGSPLDDSAKDMYALEGGEMLASPFTFVEDESTSPGAADAYLRSIREYGLRPPDYRPTRSRLDTSASNHTRFNAETLRTKC